MATRPAKPAQDIEDLRKRHMQLVQKKAGAEANLKNANERLDELRKQAREQFGTDDPEQLKAKLEAMKQENERKRAEYQQHLEGIEAALTDVEQRFDQSRGSA